MAAISEPKQLPEGLWSLAIDFVEPPSLPIVATVSRGLHEIAQPRADFIRHLLANDIARMNEVLRSNPDSFSSRFFSGYLLIAKEKNVTSVFCSAVLPFITSRATELSNNGENKIEFDKDQLKLLKDMIAVFNEDIQNTLRNMNRPVRRNAPVHMPLNEDAGLDEIPD